MQKSNRQRLLRSWPTNFNFSVDKLNESSGFGVVSADQERTILRGIIQKADTLNQNGRIYPRAILMREVQNYQKYIAERRSTGELDHPDSSVVSLKNASHLITKAWMEGDVVYGELMVLSTPSGQILMNLLADGVKLGISSRGVGTTKRDGDYHVVQDDFQIICWDMVSEPSTPDAFMLPTNSAYMPEGRELVGMPSISENIDSHQPRISLHSTLDDILSFRK
jgi:hypothetical protein